MSKKQFIIYAVLAAVFAILVYMQFRTWRHFDWDTFWSQTDQVNKRHIFHAIGLIYLAYVVRAFRWKIFLRPVRPQASWWGLIAPTLIGFAGLAILGRPGELIRPYVIARKENLPFSSQLGVWAVERIFDIGAFTLLLMIAIFVAHSPKELEYYGRFRTGGLILLGIVIGMTAIAMAISRKGEALASWIEHRFSHLAANLGKRIALRVREFHRGLNTIDSVFSLLQLIVVSVVMWCMIAVAYKEVTHSYRAEELEIPQTQVLLLMGSSMVGSMIQLPGVGGGSQLATIATLEHVFDVPHELAASCGIMLWLVTFVAVVPLGLLLAQRERLSFRKLAEESRQQEQVSVPSPSPPAST
ncbi:MAG TPA: lysylphosphatidylglycerol synthase transmembrane domain-containing protein [Terriglobales bacterium]|nr:lysylphosphatidylglycerol synthase transmembrane domain-containing protein [Terriglobales bacterium]